MSRLTGRVLALVLAAVTATAVGCGGSSVSSQRGASGVSERQVVVATYNVDFGTNLAHLFGLKDLGQIIAAAKTAYQEVLASNYPERAAAIAKVLAAARPDAAGLQEADTWEKRDPSQPGSMFSMVEDFPTLIQRDLAARGLHYDLAVMNQTFQAQMPLDGKTLVRYTDYNVILVRSDLPKQTLSTSNPAQGLYTARIQLPPPLNLQVTRGWASLDVTVFGRTFRFYTTHFETYASPGYSEDYVRNLQSKELAAKVETSQVPTVITGDINSRQPGCAEKNTTVYSTLLATGSVEVWPALHPQDRCGGYTSGQKTLLWKSSTLDHRIDDIFFQPSKMDAVRVTVVGDKKGDRTASGLWPSDHASSVATLQFKTS